MSWFRSWHGAPSDTKLSLVARDAKLPRYLVTAIWWEMLDFASQNTPRGSIKGINYEVIAFQQGIDDVTQCNACNASFRKYAMIDENDMLTGWSKRQPKREDNSSARVDKYREKQRVTQCNAYVTQRNAPDREIDTDREIEKKERKQDNSGSRFTLTEMPDDWRMFCLEKRPDLDPDELFAEFGDYWKGVPGQRGRKIDWLATWRNRVRDKKSATGVLTNGKQHYTKQPTKDERARAAVMRAAEAGGFATPGGYRGT